MSVQSQVPDPGLDSDYQKTFETFKLLADIRFKLLGFVPAIVGAAIALMGDDKSPGVMICVGALGCWGTLGILLYELRNSELYNQAIHRAKYLEGLQDFPISVEKIQDDLDLPDNLWPENGGVFSERRRGGYPFLSRIPVQHDMGIAFVYSAAMAGWVYLIVRGLTAAAFVSAPVALWTALGFAAAAGLLTWTEVILHDHYQFKPVRPHQPYEEPKDRGWTRRKSMVFAATTVIAFIVLGALAPAPRSPNAVSGPGVDQKTEIPPNTPASDAQVAPELNGTFGLLWVAMGVSIVSALAGLAILIFNKDHKAAGAAVAVAGLTTASLLGRAQFKFSDFLKPKIDNHFNFDPMLIVALNRLGSKAPIKIGDIRGFASGHAEIAESMNEDLAKVCTSWKEHAKDGGLLMLVGSTDRTPLNAETHRRFESNSGLARSRAEAVKKQIEKQCSVPFDQMSTGITGPGYTPALGAGDPPSKGALDDRHVEVWAFWNSSSTSFELEVGKKDKKEKAKKASR